MRGFKQDHIKLLFKNVTVPVNDSNAQGCMKYYIYLTDKGTWSEASVFTFLRNKKIRRKMSESPSFDRLTVVQLRDSCQRRGLETSGLKRELINRLKTHEGTVKYPKKN